MYHSKPLFETPMFINSDLELRVPVRLPRATPAVPIELMGDADALVPDKAMSDSPLETPSF